MPEAPPPADSIAAFTDADSVRTMQRALRFLLLMTVLGAGLAYWKLGWQSAVLLLIGAAISGSGLWEWTRLMKALMARMDGGGEARPVGLLLVGFFLRLLLAFVAVYVSLRFLNGTVYALVAGLALGVLALSVEGIRLVKAWTT